MKKLVLALTAFAFSLGVYAQSLQEGIKLVNYGRYQSAITALQSQSGDEAQYYLGLAQIGAGNIQAAQDIFNKNAQSFYSRAGLARTYFLQNRKEDAMKLLQAIVDDARKKEWEKYKIAADAITYTKGGDINTAIAWYKKALEIKDEPGTQLALGDAYLKLQSGGGDAMTSYETALAKTDNKSLVYSRMGSLWYQARNYEEALKNYNLAKDADPNNPMPYKDLADAYYRVGKYELAKQNIEKYLSLSDKSVDDQIEYANLLYLSQDYTDAIAKMNELIKSGNEKPYMYRVLAFSQYETKDYTNAYANLKTFFSKETDDSGIIPEDYLYMGKIYNALAAADTTKTKIYADSANASFQKGIAKDTASDKSKMYRAIAESFKNTDYAITAQWYGKTVNETPDSTVSPNDYKQDIFWWGIYTYYSNDYSKAAEIFSMMAAKYPEEPQAVLWQGMVAIAQDQKAESGAAIPYLQKWLSMPGDKRPADQMKAYQYIAFYYYNKKDKAQTLDYISKIEQIDADNDFAKQVRKAFANEAEKGKSK